MMMAFGGPRRRSLRRQLLVPLAWVWLLGMGMAVMGAFWLARNSANAAFDRGLQDEAAALAARITWSDRGPFLDQTRQAMEAANWDGGERNGFVLLAADGTVLAGDALVPVPQPVPTLAGPSASFERPLLVDARHQGKAVRAAMFSVASPMLDSSVTLIVVETPDKRQALLRDILLAMALPALALGSLTFSLLAWGISRGVRPLQAVAAEVAGRSERDWRPLSLEQVPLEALPLIERINTLLSDVRASVSVQRRFVADAAHQLRTPVAGIRVLTQELQQEMASCANQAHAPVINALLLSSDRLSRLIGQLLSLVRSEAALSFEGEQSLQDIVPLVREAAEPLALRALREGRNLALEAPEDIVLARAHGLWLGEALANVIDNALRYGGPNIVVRVLAQPGGALLSVEDDGPGIAAADLPRICEPFWRGERADIRTDGGTGLGLAIAHDVVVRLGGRLLAESRPDYPGLRISMVLSC